MKEKQWKPILAPNEQPNLDKIKYPLLASQKIDGIRCIFYKGQILSRSLKQIQNKQLREKFEPIRLYSEENNLILDGEVYSPELTFQEITSFVMTQDFEDKKSIKKYKMVKVIPDHLKFHCFDVIRDDNLELVFSMRYAEGVLKIGLMFPRLVVSVYHKRVESKDDVEEYFQQALDDNSEGLILRDYDGRYKCGRGTLKEGLIYKVKPYRNFDAKITGVVQSTVVDPNAEKTTNELGNSVTSKKLEDRILIEKASAFNVNYCTECDDTGTYLNGSESCKCPFCKTLKVVLAMSDEEKEDVWKNKESLIGRWIQYKGMLVGAKDVPRHPVMERFRDDKN